MGRPTRRGAILGAGGLLLMRTAHALNVDGDLAQLEAKSGGRLGVAATKVGADGGLYHRADQAFLFCSTFKFPLAAAILHHAREGALSLDQVIAYTDADFVGHAPATRAKSDHQMTVRDLARAAVVVSDNTAANLLFPLIGGPPGLTRFFRSLSDSITRSDRNEPSLNSHDSAHDLRDTTTPRAMMAMMGRLALGHPNAPLAADDQVLLASWLLACQTGNNRLRAGFPKDWITGDKTGTGSTISGDVAFSRRPDGAQILAAVYFDAPGLSNAARDAVIAQAGAVIAAKL
jgi:beta-lactamase class A